MTDIALHRRELLAGGFALALAPALPAESRSPTESPFDRQLDDFCEEILQLAPTTATAQGLDTGPRAYLKSQLDDLSPRGEAAWASQLRSMKDRLQRIPRASLTPVEQLRYDTVDYAVSQGLDGAAFGIVSSRAGFSGWVAPYPVTQQDGAILWIPEFLDTQHQIAESVDCDTYLERLGALGRMLDQETARISRNAAAGIVAPSFIGTKTLDQLRNFRATPADRQKLAASLADRAERLGIPGDWRARAVRLIETGIYPALDRQIAALAAAQVRATEAAGIGRLPDGQAFYGWALKVSTTTTIPPEEVHAVGLAQTAELGRRLDDLLREQGLTRGSVGERLHALTRDPRSLFPDDDEGRAQIIAYVNQAAEAIRPIMPRLSNLGLRADFELRRVPTDIQDGAPLGSMIPGALDGSRPAIYYINLKSTGLWPRHELKTLTAHEGVPGHVWQSAYLIERSADLPRILSLTYFNGYIEGWALYAEQLCDEIGLYADDPLSRIGYLQAQMFRACRLVVDTGIHAMGWSREQAVRFLIEKSGRGAEAVASEVDRYCVSPGQACGYKVGHNEILRLREHARRAMGADFDLAAFTDAVVATGGVPLTVLARTIDQFVAAGTR